MSFTRSLRVLVSAAEPAMAEKVLAAGIRAERVAARPDGQTLAELGRLLAAVHGLRRRR
jgi:hypothetical protein